MSEFGRGYAVCLIQFLWHEPRLRDQVTRYEALRGSKDPEVARLFRETDAVEMWANGAADHLVDIVRPRRWITRAEWSRAKALADHVYEAGRQYRGDRDYTAADMRAAMNEAEALLHAYSHAAGRPVPATFAEAWAFDEAAGLKPERGDSATCEGPIPVRETLG